MSLRIGGALAVAIAASARLAHAAPTDADVARQRYEAGEAAMRASPPDYPTACQAFVDSYALVQDGHTLAREALCFELSGKLASALAAWRVVRDAKVSEEDKTDAYKHVTDLEGRVGRVVVIDEGELFARREYTMEIDGVPAVLNNEVPTDAGARTVVIHVDGGADLVTRVIVTDGRTSTVKTGYAANYAMVIAGAVTLTLGVGAGIGFILTAKEAATAQTEMREACPRYGFTKAFASCNASAPDIDARGEALVAANLALGILTIPLIATGAPLLSAGAGATAGRPRLVAVAPVVTHEGGGLFVSGVF